jgi:glycerol-3-phosphate acyltransferase PlsY
MKELLIVVLCYLVGSIPFSYIIVKLVKGVDIRTVGSKNVGATNAGRVLGKWGFISSFLLDMSKSYIPIMILKNYYSTNYLLLFSFFMILGHTYTIFLKFKGGKGVATAVGVYLAISPKSLIIALTVFIIVAVLFKMVSLSSITAAIALFISVMFLESSVSLKIFTFVVVVFVIYKHKDNIRRILNKTERKIGERIG